jgi:hypothetical protein
MEVDAMVVVSSCDELMGEEWMAREGRGDVVVEACLLLPTSPLLHSGEMVAFLPSALRG